MKKRFYIFVILLVCISSLMYSSNKLNQNNHLTTDSDSLIDLTYEDDEQKLVESETEYSVYSDPVFNFELPLNGSTGYASININVREEPTSASKLLFTLNAGTGFTIIEEDESWWLVDINGSRGYVYHEYCFINLLDVLPSIIYKNTNATNAVFTSSYQPIPNITGEKLYEAMSYNERLGFDEFIMPVLYGTAKKISMAQHFAKEEGKTLILYETYRPYDVQVKIRDELRAVSLLNNEINAGISTALCSTSWFISSGISHHQRGFAIDVSVGDIQEIEEVIVGDYVIQAISQYEEAVMPTPIHELSSLSKSMAYPVNSNNDIDWRTTPLSDTMNESAIKLREYCTQAGLTPLASEWWHFNDLDYYGKTSGKGEFYLTEVFSKVPSVIYE